jgi:hypothetical protein
MSTASVPARVNQSPTNLNVARTSASRPPPAPPGRDAARGRARAPGRGHHNVIPGSVDQHVRGLMKSSSYTAVPISVLRLVS